MDKIMYQKYSNDGTAKPSSEADVIRPIRFFCPHCGKEMWELSDLENQKQYTIEHILKLLDAGCSDCLLKNMRNAGIN